MYKIYDTKGFVIEKRDLGSDDFSYYIFTKDFGFITAKAYSVRLEKSKMSNFLQSLNFCNLSLTRGKGGWVITGGNLIHSIFYKNNIEVAELYKKVFKLVSKLSIREESQLEIFKIMEESLVFQGNKEISVLEVFLYIKVLNEFGYINIEQVNAKVSGFSGKNTLDSDISEKITKNKDFLVNKLNESLSQLDI